jgi:hypothetical protein
MPVRSLAFVTSVAIAGAIAACEGGPKQPPARDDASPSSSSSAAATAPPDAAPPASASASAALTASAAPAEAPLGDEIAPTLELQREQLFARMQRGLALRDGQLDKVKAIFAGSTLVGQGNPYVTQHPMLRSTCRARRAAAGLGPRVEPKCGAPNMVPIFDRAGGETAKDAKVCIDQFEFPDIPCEYPVVYARASEAVDLCEAVGKRICDAHEWEGACAGSLRDPEVDYFFGKPRPYATWLHNQSREMIWAYGPTKDMKKCATGAKHSPKCEAGGWTLCGSNTYPAGSFPECVSVFGVYDQHGNAAEHMSLPTDPRELGSRHGLGQTEMKGSWFIFQEKEAHEDDCRWRAKDWHPSWVNDPESHRNYHLGFRCCKDVD